MYVYVCIYCIAGKFDKLSGFTVLKPSPLFIHQAVVAKQLYLANFNLPRISAVRCVPLYMPIVTKQCGWL